MCGGNVAGNNRGQAINGSGVMANKLVRKIMAEG